jgi:hypothetical protein
MTLSQIKKLPLGNHDAMLGGIKGTIEIFKSEYTDKTICTLKLPDGYLHIDLKRSKKQGIRFYTIIEGLSLDTIVESHSLRLI